MKRTSQYRVIGGAILGGAIGTVVGFWSILTWQVVQSGLKMPEDADAQNWIRTAQIAGTIVGLAIGTLIGVGIALAEYRQDRSRNARV